MGVNQGWNLPAFWWSPRSFQDSSQLGDKMLSVYVHYNL